MKKRVNVKLHSFTPEKNCYADLIFPMTDEQVKYIRVYPQPNGFIQVSLPKGMQKWTVEDAPWDEIRKIVSARYKKYWSSQSLKPEEEKIPEKEIEISWEDPSTGIRVLLTHVAGDRYSADVTIPGMHSTIQNFVVCHGIGGGVQVYMPSYMGTRWALSEVSWIEVRTVVTEAYRSLDHSQDILPSAEEAAPEPNTLTEITELPEAASGIPKRNSKEATGSLFAFYPHTVLRETSSEKLGKKAKENQKQSVKNTNYVYELVKGSESEITAFHLRLLEWIAKLHYSTNNILLDILGDEFHENLTFEKRKEKINKAVFTLYNFGLVDITNLVSLDLSDQDGKKHGAPNRIYTLRFAGFQLLLAMERFTTQFHQTDLIREGNTVKKFLTANQWLASWIANYPLEIVNRIETSKTLSYHLQESTKAKIYASVTVNEQPLVVEPVRRCEDFEKMEVVEETRQKFDRLTLLLSHFDNLKENQYSYIFSQRPILIYLCEDDAHIQEIAEVLASQIQAHPEQMIWFTTDLRTYNDTYANQRYVLCQDGQLSCVDYAGILGIPKEVI